MFRSTTTRRTIATLTLAAALTGAGAGFASAATLASPASATPTSTASSVPAVSTTSSTTSDPGKGLTSITMTITNNTDQPLTLHTADNPYGHWQDRATNLGAYASETVSDYSDNIAGASIALTYTLPDGSTVTFAGSAPVEPPQAGATGSTTDHGYTVDANGSTGFAVHDTYSLNNA